MEDSMIIKNLGKIPIVLFPDTEIEVVLFQGAIYENTLYTGPVFIKAAEEGVDVLSKPAGTS